MVWRGPQMRPWGALSTRPMPETLFYTIYDVKVVSRRRHRRRKAERVPELIRSVGTRQAHARHTPGTRQAQPKHVPPDLENGLIRASFSLTHTHTSCPLFILRIPSSCRAGPATPPHATRKLVSHYPTRNPKQCVTHRPPSSSSLLPSSFVRSMDHRLDA